MKFNNLTIISNCNYTDMEGENDHNYDKNIIVLTDSNKKDIIYDISLGKRIEKSKIFINVDKTKLEDVFRIDNDINIDDIKSIINYRFVSLKNTFNNVLLDSFMFIEIVDINDNKMYIDLNNQKKIPCKNVEIIKYDFSSKVDIFNKDNDVHYKYIDLDRKIMRDLDNKIKLYKNEVMNKTY